MKKNYVTILAMILVLTSCQEKIDIEKENEAIKSVIMSETNFTHAKDFDQSSNLFIKDSSFIYLSASKYGYVFHDGWENYSMDTKDWMERFSTPTTNQFEFTNFRIKVCTKSAMAFYDEEVRNSDGEFLMKFLNVRFLEKIEGEWKIAFMSFVNTTTYEEIGDDLLDEIERED